MYKELKPMLDGLKVTTILRQSDNAYIPLVPVNSDYKAYLVWLEEGNTPEPAENL